MGVLKVLLVIWLPRRARSSVRKEDMVVGTVVCCEETDPGRPEADLFFDGTGRTPRSRFSGN